MLLLSVAEICIIFNKEEKKSLLDENCWSKGGLTDAKHAIIKNRRILVF